MNPRLKLIGLGLAAIVAVGGALVGGFLVFLHTGPGERWIAGRIEQALSGPEITVDLDGYHFGWPFRMYAEAARVSDRQGVWLDVTRPELQWHPLRLWRRSLDIDRLVADRVEVRRLPQLEAGGETRGGGLPQGTLHLDELKAPIVLDEPVLGERVELELGGSFRMHGGSSGGGGSVDVHLRSVGGELVRIDGTAGGDFLDLRWYLRIPELARWQRLAGVPLAGEAGGSGFIAGRLPSPVVSGQLDFGPGMAGDLAWRALTLSGSVMPDAATLHVSLMAEARAPQLEGKPAPFPSATLAVVGDLVPASGRASIGHLRAEAAGVAATAAGTINDWGHEASLRVRVALNDLGAVGALGGLDLKGRASVRGQLAGDLVRPSLRGRFEASTRAFASGIAALDRLLGSGPMAEAALAYRDGRLALDDATVQGDRATLRAAGTVARTLDLWSTLSVPDLSAVAPGLAGAGVMQARVVGPPGDPSAFGLAHVAALAVAGAPPGDGALAFDLAHLARRPAGTVTADLSVAGYPVDGRARLDVGPEVQVRDLLLLSGDSRLAGDLVVAHGGVRGRLKGSIPELGRWERLMGRPVSGRVEAEAILDPRARQSLRLTGRAERVVLAGFSVGSATVEAAVTDLAAAPRGTVAVDAASVAGQGGRLDHLSARLAGDGRAFRFEAQGRGAGAQVDADGSAALDGRSGQARVDRLRVVWGDINAALLRPARLDWSAGGVTLAPALVALGGGRLEAEGRLSGRTLSGSARLQDVPLGLVSAVAPGVDVVGAVSGTANIGGTLDDPRAHAALTGRNVGFAAAARAGIGRLNARLVADLGAGRVQGQASAGEPGKLRANADFSVSSTGEGPLSGRFQVAGDIGRITEALPLPGHGFAGHVSAEGTVGGTVAAPRLDGRATWSDGRYENLESGTLVTALTASAVLDGDRIRVTAQGSDGGRGVVRAEGDGGWDGRYRADLTLGKFTLLRRDDLEAEVDGTVRLAGQGEQGRLEGDLTVPRAEVDIARFKASGPVSLQVIEINRPGAPAKPERERRRQEEAPVTLALGVQVAVEHAFVRGRGLDSEWQGKVGVGGTLSRPSLTGRLVAARGEYAFLGKRFRLSPDSEVVFQGGDSIDPSLNVTAEAQAEEITAQVKVTGTAKQPEVAITSQPALPQDEVLARVLFGREAGKLSAVQQIQLAQMAASGLTGAGEGFDPIGDIRSFLGLDVLGVGTAEEKRTATGRPAASSAAPTLSAGKYVGRDTFVRVDQGTGGLGKVTVEQELGGGFSVESSLGEQSGGGLGFNWRKDY